MDLKSCDRENVSPFSEEVSRKTEKTTLYEPIVSLNIIEYDFGLKFKIRQLLRNDWKSDVTFLRDEEENVFMALFDENDIDFEIRVENDSRFNIRFEVRLGNERKGKSFIVKKGIRSTLKTLDTNGDSLHFVNQFSDNENENNVSKNENISEDLRIGFKVDIEMTDEEIELKNRRRIERYKCLLTKREITTEPMVIFVKTLNGKLINLDTFSNDSIELIKHLIQEKEGTNPELQRLIFGGKQLENEKKLCDYNIENESTVEVSSDWKQDVVSDRALLPIGQITDQRFKSYNRRFVKSDKYSVEGFTLDLRTKSIDSCFRVLEKLYFQINHLV